MRAPPKTPVRVLMSVPDIWRVDPKGWIRPFLQSAHPGGSDSDHQKLREAAEVLVPGEQGEIMLHCGILAQWNS